MQQQVSDFKQDSTASWWNTSLRRWEQGNTSLTIPYAGVYAVAVEYIWYPFFDNVGQDYAYSWISHYDYRTNAYLMGQQGTCSY